jgi:hypothetical protein
LASNPGIGTWFLGFVGMLALLSDSLRWIKAWLEGFSFSFFFFFPAFLGLIGYQYK